MSQHYKQTSALNDEKKSCQYGIIIAEQGCARSFDLKFFEVNVEARAHTHAPLLSRDFIDELKGLRKNWNSQIAAIAAER